MAAAAEQLAHNFDYYAPPQYSPVDGSFLLAGIRAAARTEALAIVEDRREQLRQADYDAVPLPVDAIGSAAAVLAARQESGPDSAAAAEKQQGLILDCQRLLAEAARKNTYEYFPPLRQTYDATRQEYVSHGFSILGMTAAGLTPVAEPEELERRINERIEEVTYLAIGRLALGERMIASAEEQAKATQPRRIRTISECPDWAIEAHESRSAGGYGGYVPEIRKFMVRDVVFDPATGDRYEEQVGVPGTLISHDIITAVLAEQGVESAGELTKTELHGMQLEADDDLLDFIMKLDKSAAEQHDQPVFMGEAVVRPGRYDEIPVAASARQAALEQQATGLADDILELAAAGTDRWLATDLVGRKVKDILFSVAKQDISLAADMFDQATASGLSEVALLQQQGDIAQASSRLAQVEAQAPAPSYCGAGSCGLENVSATSREASSMKEMGLESKGSLKDTARRCPKCSKKEIVYDLKNKKKGCLGCKSTGNFSKQ